MINTITTTFIGQIVISNEWATAFFIFAKIILFPIGFLLFFTIFALLGVI